tara:strand:+ start:247 stop:378 length:132 start_codon:yes stop_codon:yes gene_type:complete
MRDPKAKKASKTSPWFSVNQNKEANYGSFTTRKKYVAKRSGKG